MIAADYEKILHSLACAARTLDSHQGELSDCDLRIRGMISIARTETTRRLESLHVPVTDDGKHPAKLVAASRE